MSAAKCVSIWSPARTAAKSCSGIASWPFCFPVRHVFFRLPISQSASKSPRPRLSNRRIRVARWQRFRDRAEIVLDNVLRPITLPATGGFVSAMLVFVFVLHLMAPGITVQAIPNDVPLNLMQPAELVTLSDSPGNWAPENHDTELSLPHGLLLDVTVDAAGPDDGLPDSFRAKNAAKCSISSTKCCSSPASLP